MRVARDRGLDANLTIVGKQVPNDATVREANRLAYDLGIDQNVFWLGQLTATGLRAVYSTADILLLPSRHEGFGFPAIEAMWFDLPVIVSNSGALPEVVENGGLIFNTEDHVDLAEKIIMLHENSEIRARTLEAARNIRKSYTLEKFAENIRLVFDRYLN